MLTRLLSEEKAKTAILRDDLIANVTSMITGFTNAQDHSWSTAVAGVQTANENGVTSLGKFKEIVDQGWTEGSRRRGVIEKDLGKRAENSHSKRASGLQVCRAALQTIWWI